MISIITPSKNIVSQGRLEFFKRQMETLRAQTYQDFEHILVDGGSEDGTLDILKEYSDAGLIDTLISEKDSNLHEAINKGLKLAKGEFIYVMNTDNYFASNDFFERSLKAIEDHKVDYTHADRIIVKRDGNSPSVKKGNLRVAFYRMPFRWQTMLIKKEIYDEFGPFDESYTIAADYKFMLKMIMAGKKGYYFPESLLYSLDGGITIDRKLCIKEVSQVLYEIYGKKYKLTLEDCDNIYQRTIRPELMQKILKNVKDERIVESIKYGYEHERAN